MYFLYVLILWHHSPADRMSFALWTAAPHISLATQNMNSNCPSDVPLFKTYLNLTCFRVPQYNAKLLLTSEESWSIPKIHPKICFSTLYSTNTWKSLPSAQFANSSGNFSSFSSFFSTSTVWVRQQFPLPGATVTEGRMPSEMLSQQPEDNCPTSYATVSRCTVLALWLSHVISHSVTVYYHGSSLCH